MAAAAHGHGVTDHEPVALEVHQASELQVAALQVVHVVAVVACRR